MTRSPDLDCLGEVGSSSPSSAAGTLRPDFVLPRLFDSLGLFSNPKLFGEAQAIALRRVGSGQGERGGQQQLCSKE